MEKIFFTIKENTFVSPSLPSPYTLPPPQPTIDSNGGAFDFSSKVSPSILLIIIILAIIFFVSGLLHLLVRFLLRPNRDPDDLESVTALQGQLQQLFHLHDAGVDQSFIDTLPVFNYKAIIGLKDPFDCAVCLCEFEAEDKLRLLPKCSHAFHMDCIDTWLLSHSTCPLCRASLFSDFSSNNTCSPVVLVLESGSESSREIVNDGDCNFGRSSSVLTAHYHLGSQRDLELGSTNVDYLQKSGEVLDNEDKSVLTAVVVDSGEKVVPVKLGKFRNVDIGEGCSTTNSIDSRRCYSMGSFEYVMDENSSLQVPIRTPMKKQSSKKPSLPLTPGHRQAMSECDCESRREFSGFEGIFRSNVEVDNNSSSNSNSIVRSKKESFSISKIWLRSKNETQKPTENSSRKAASFRFPLTKNVAAEDDLKVKDNVNGISRRTNSEIGSEWCDMIVENHQSCNISLDSQAKTPSFARRTLNWLVGKQNKVVHSSFVTPKE